MTVSGNPRAPRRPPGRWAIHAQCRLEGEVGFWFEVTSRGGIPQRGEAEANAKRARHICRRCPVQVPCLIEAIVNAEPADIWGGLTRPERTHAARVAPWLRTADPDDPAFVGITTDDVLHLAHRQETAV